MSVVLSEYITGEKEKEAVLIFFAKSHKKCEEEEPERFYFIVGMSF